MKDMQSMVHVIQFCRKNNSLSRFHPFFKLSSQKQRINIRHLFMSCGVNVDTLSRIDKPKSSERKNRSTIETKYRLLEAKQSACNWNLLCETSTYMICLAHRDVNRSRQHYHRWRTRFYVFRNEVARSKILAIKAAPGNRIVIGKIFDYLYLSDYDPTFSLYQ